MAETLLEFISAFVIGALMLCSALHKSRLTPRWLSIRGVLAAVAVLAASLLAAFDISVLAALLVIPK
jgi:hypothetical protein